MSWTVDSLSYDNRQKIEIDNTNVDTDLTDFPKLIKFTDNSNVGGATNADGHDIRFTSSNGTTLLKYEREVHTVASGEATCIYWVKVPTVSSSGKTTIYMYHRSADTTDGEDAENVWDANTVGVWHFAEASWNGTAGEVKDSTGANDGTAAGGATTATGKIGRGGTFDGDGDYVEKSSPSDLDFGTGAFAVSFWYYPKAFKSNGGLVSKYAGGDDGWYVSNSSSSPYNDILFKIAAGTDTFLSADTNLVVDTWYHIVAKHAADGASSIYVDGSLVESGTLDIDSDSAAALQIGALLGASFEMGNGLLDEVRVSDTARSDDWIKFEYYEQNEADNEIALTNEEAEEEPPAGDDGQVIWISQYDNADEFYDAEMAPRVQMQIEATTLEFDPDAYRVSIMEEDVQLSDRMTRQRTDNLNYWSDQHLDGGLGDHDE
jgi:hypothetical protein